MFDWDEDYEELVKPRPDQEASRARQAPTAGQTHRFGLVVLCLIAVICAGYFGQYVWRGTSAFTAGPVTGAPESSTELHIAPECHLQALDSTQALRFQTGLRGFSDSHLLGYARHARSDHDAASEFMRPYLADAETLIGLELARRGF